MERNKELGKRENLLIRALKGRAEIHRHMGNFDKGINDYQNIISFCERRGYTNLSLIPEDKIGLSSIFTEGKSDYKKAEEMARQALTKIKQKKESKAKQKK